MSKGDLRIFPFTKREEGFSLIFFFFHQLAESSEEIAVHIIGAEAFPLFHFSFLMMRWKLMASFL
jgi:hypothetical protein